MGFHVLMQAEALQGAVFEWEGKSKHLGAEHGEALQSSAQSLKAPGRDKLLLLVPLL